MSLDRIKRNLAAFIDAYLGRRVDYFAFYPATVTNQAADGTLEVLPDDQQIRGGGMASVPVRYGLPGFRAEVPDGARCMVGFDAGDPKRPYVATWMEDSLGGGSDVVDLLEFDGGSKSVARVDDETANGYLIQDNAPGPPAPTMTLWWAPESGAPGVPGAYVLVQSNPGGAITPPPGTPGTPVAGLIITGNDKLKS